MSGLGNLRTEAAAMPVQHITACRLAKLLGFDKYPNSMGNYFSNGSSAYLFARYGQRNLSNVVPAVAKGLH